MRIAIVGFGPKGLFALERLLDHAAGLAQHESLAIDLFEPDPNPAAGPNYAPDQPDYLRMNFSADLIDMWWPDSHAVPRSAQRLFARWRPSPGEGERAPAYPPRAEVGTYLSDGFEALLRYAPRAATVSLRALAIDAVRARGEGWELHAGGSAVGTYDEVLLSTGHLRTSATALEHGWSQAAPLVPRVFPVGTWLTPERVPAGAVAAIRGFGLTFIDAAIALSQGRGGTFLPTRHPYRLHYSPGREAIAAIVPFARSGRPMLAKPGPEIADAHPDLAAIAQRGRAQLVALAGAVDLCHELLPILARCASESLGVTRGRHDENPDAWFADAAAGTLPATGLSAVDEIERSLAVGTGLAPPDLSWAVGQSWRSLYPALVHRLGGGGLREEDWPAFRRLAAEMERMAFGPSPLNAAKLVALVEAGVVDLSLVAGAALRDRDGRTWLHGPAGERAVDVVVDAVLPGPGLLPGQDAMLDGLVADGHIRAAGGQRGIDVDVDGTCRSRDGSPSAGLAATGRPTEDAVIGNDTLSRSLHPLSDRWARRVIARRRAESALRASGTAVS